VGIQNDESHEFIVPSDFVTVRLLLCHLNFPQKVKSIHDIVQADIVVK
jgi:hypothetical protein